MFSIKRRIRQVIRDFQEPPVASESLSVRPGRVGSVEKRQDILDKAFELASKQYAVAEGRPVASRR
jgi:hypothetical protein